MLRAGLLQRHRGQDAYRARDTLRPCRRRRAARQFHTAQFWLRRLTDADPSHKPPHSGGIMWNFRFDSRAWYASAALETTNLTEKENPCLRSVLRKNYARESLDKHRLVAQVSDNHSLAQPLMTYGKACRSPCSAGSGFWHGSGTESLDRPRLCVWLSRHHADLRDPGHHERGGRLANDRVPRQTALATTEAPRTPCRSPPVTTAVRCHSQPVCWSDLTASGLQFRGNATSLRFERLDPVEWIRCARGRWVRTATGLLDGSISYGRR